MQTIYLCNSAVCNLKNKQLNGVAFQKGGDRQDGGQRGPAEES
jgi:hypothetical protein